MWLLVVTLVVFSQIVSYRLLLVCIPCLSVVLNYCKTLMQWCENFPNFSWFHLFSHPLYPTPCTPTPCTPTPCVLIILLYRGRFCIWSARSPLFTLYREYCYIKDHDYIGVLSHTILLQLLPGNRMFIVFLGISLYHGSLYQGITVALVFCFFNELLM